MSVSRADVARIARLARLAVDDSETERLAAELSSILDHMLELGTLDLAGVPPFSSAAEHVAPPRVDEPGADALVRPPAAAAPAWADAFFTVPRLIGGATQDGQ